MLSHVLRTLFALLHKLRLPRGFLNALILRLGLIFSRLRRLKFLSPIINPKTGVSDCSLAPPPPTHPPRSTAYESASLACDEEPIYASTVPHSAFRPTRQGSLSHPNLRVTLDPITTTPRPASVSYASPTNTSHSPTPPTLSTSSISGVPVSYNASLLSVNDPSARARAEFIQHDARSGRRLSRARAPARQAVSATSRSPSRNSRPQSRTHLQRVSTPVASVTHIPADTESGISISLEPASPELGRRSSTEVGFRIQSPSSGSFSINGSTHTAQSTPTETDSHTVLSMVMPELLAGRKLQEMIPEAVPRYNQLHSIPDEVCSYTVPRLNTIYPYSEIDLGEWAPIMHTEGCLYFYHRRKRIYTEVYLYESNYLEEVEQFVQYLEGYLYALGKSLPSRNCELVIQIDWAGDDDDESIIWQYYYVDHDSRCLVWLNDFVVDDFLYEVTGTMSPSHFKHILESWYWDHVSLFPDGFDIQNRVGLIDELIGILSYFSVDIMTSPTTTVPYTLEELNRMIKLLGRKNPGAGATALTSGLGRILSIFCHWRYIHFHGQRHARLDRNQSIHGSDIRIRSWLMRMFSYMFFMAPEVHLKDIEKLYVDRIVLTSSWKRHILKLQGEWQEFVLYATVMLNANVAFLAIPDVILFPDNPNNPGGGNDVQSYLPPLRSPAAIASYVSILCSVGSIVLGLLLVRHNRTKNRDVAPEAAAYMQAQESRWFFHEPLAILYSLPYALLMWAMLSFLTGVMIFCLRNTDVATQATVAGVAFVVSCLIVWCAIAAYDMSPEWRLFLGDVTAMVILGRENGARAHLRRFADRVRTSARTFIKNMPASRTPYRDAA